MIKITELFILRWVKYISDNGSGLDYLKTPNIFNYIVKQYNIKSFCMVN